MGNRKKGFRKKAAITDREIISRYNKGLTLAALAKETGLSRATVANRLREYGVQMHPLGYRMASVSKKRVQAAEELKVIATANLRPLRGAAARIEMLQADQGCLRWRVA